VRRRRYEARVSDLNRIHRLSLCFLLLSCLVSILPSWKRRGLRLSELADVLIQRADARFAINLDGGSSSVLINYNRTVSRPTCLDVVPIVCERPVASVVCIQPPMATNGLFSAHRVES
jgi:Phosphodiester glycosidase